MDRLYLDDLHPGQSFSAGPVTVETGAVKAFASQFDPQPFHLDEAAAAQSLFGGLVASGWHTAALTMRLLVDGGAPIAGGLIGVGGSLTWPRPTRPGDRLSVTCEVMEVVPSRSRPDRGMVTVHVLTLNQHGETVQDSTMRLRVPRRPAG